MAQKLTTKLWSIASFPWMNKVFLNWLEAETWLICFIVKVSVSTETLSSWKWPGTEVLRCVLLVCSLLFLFLPHQHPNLYRTAFPLPPVNTVRFLCLSFTSVVISSGCRKVKRWKIDLHKPERQWEFIDTARPLQLLPSISVLKLVFLRGWRTDVWNVAPHICDFLSKQSAFRHWTDCLSLRLRPAFVWNLGDLCPTSEDRLQLLLCQMLC